MEWLAVIVLFLLLVKPKTVSGPSALPAISTAAGGTATPKMSTPDDILTQVIGGASDAIDTVKGVIGGDNATATPIQSGGTITVDAADPGSTDIEINPDFPPGDITNPIDDSPVNDGSQSVNIAYGPRQSSPAVAKSRVKSKIALETVPRSPFGTEHHVAKVLSLLGR